LALANAELLWLTKQVAPQGDYDQDCDEDKELTKITTKITIKTRRRARTKSSMLVTEFPQIQEMDINPFMVGRPGTTPVAVDARISVEEAKR
jgi:hypothetical protein